MLRPYVSLVALALCLALAGPAAAHGDDRAERGDRGERGDRAERAERDRARDADKISRDRERDTQKASERAAKDRDFAAGGSGSDGGAESDLRTAEDATLAGAGEDRVTDENDDGGESVEERSDSSGSGSGDALEDEADQSGSEDRDDDERSDEDNSGSDDDGDDEEDDERDNEDDEKEDEEDDEADADDNDADDSQTSANLISGDDGHVYRDREVLVLLPEPDQLERLSAAGFTVIEKRELRRDGALLIRVGFAEDIKAADAVSEVRRLYPSAAIDLSHAYKASSELADSAGVQALPEKLDDRRSDVSIAVIDGFSSASLPVGVELKSFVKRKSDLPHGAQVMSVLLDDLRQIGAGHPKRLFAADVAERFENSSAQALVYNLVDALDWAASEGADVINISLAGPPNQVLEVVVNSLRDEGIMMIAAVGNTGPASRPGYPAAYGSVVGVTAVSSNGAPYIYAARGEEVELSAQGVGIRLSPDSDVLSGTSFAVPRVAALAASLMTAEPADDHREGLRALARDLGAPGRDDVYGYGLIPTPDELKRN